MRKVYNILQKLRDQEKKERQLEFAQAESARLDAEIHLNTLRESLEQGRLSQYSESPNDMAMREHLNMQRHFDVVTSEYDLQDAEVESSKKRDSLLEAQKESKIMEELIESIQTQEEKDYALLQSKQNDELGGLSWWRKQ